MSEYQKAFINGLIWTTVEAFVGSAAAAGALSKINWDIVGFAVVIADGIYIVKTLKYGVQGVKPAEETTDTEVKDEPVIEYPEDNYDDLAIDDDVDEGDEPEAYDDEVE